MQTYKFFKDLWDKAENKKEFVQKCYDYWAGDFEKVDKGSNNSENCIRQIVEAKTTLSLDNMITLDVVPQVGSFENIKTINTLQQVADIHNDALKDILSKNHFDKLKEKIMRWGEICGFAPCETIFDKDKSVQGDVVINALDPRSVRWDKSAKAIKDVAYFGVEIQMSAQTAKKMFAYDSNTGEEDIAICEIIDEAARTEKEQARGKRKEIINYTDGKSGGQAYVEDIRDRTQASTKIVKVIRLYLKDESLYLFKKDDSSQDTEVKEEWIARYPYGRVVVFLPDDKTETILKDEALPQSFSEDFGLSVFNPLELDTIEGHGEVEPLMYLQDRINKACIKLRDLVATYMSAICLPDGLIDLDEGDLPNTKVIKGNFPLGAAPAVLTNNTLDQIQNVLGLIDNYERKMLKIARINEVLLSGEQPTDVQSAAQLGQLKESPMAGIRQIQRNFKDFLIDVGNKCLSLINEYYDVQRLIKLSTKIDGAQFAQYSVKVLPNGETALDTNGVPIRTITLFDEQGNVLNAIELSSDWKFTVEITAGTDIPRSRTENAAILTAMYQNGQLGDPKNPEVQNMYFTAIDLPNRRAILNFLKEQEKNKPPVKPITDDTEYMKSVADFVAKVGNQGYGAAVRAMLAINNLPDTPNSLLDVPIDKLAQRSQIVDVQALRTQAGENVHEESQIAEHQVNQFVQQSDQ